MPKNLLILGCSATKNHQTGPMPAARRYRGAYYQILHNVPGNKWPEIVILSAKLGFIRGEDLIEDYDLLLDKARSQELCEDETQRSTLLSLLSSEYENVFVAAGSLYRSVITRHLPQNLSALARHATGGIGMQRKQLKIWLASIQKTTG